MKIAFNPSTVAALTTPPNNKDITFDLRGQNIFARGVKFCGTDTNTWRDIKINNVSIGSNILDLRNGSNTTLTNSNGVVTINSTWRPVVDNLTSDSTTSSLSANQGRILKALIDSKLDSDHNHDDRYVRKSGDTMLGALNFANGTWNLVGNDSYMGDCNVSGHFGIKAANTTYPGIAFFNNASTFLGNLTAYSGNIKYGAYSLQFLDNGNTSVSASAWTNPFNSYNSNAVADGQAICVWGQSSQLSNLATDTGDMSLWLKRVNAKVATLNMVLDGEYYANGNQRLAHVSEIPTSLKNPHALTISLNGTSQGPYDGSAAKNINITPGSIGAATSEHNHDGRYVRYYTVTTLNCNNLAVGLTVAKTTATNAAHTNPSAYLYISDVGTPFQIQIPDSNVPYIYKRYYSSGTWSGWFKLNAGYADSAGSVAWDNITGKPSSYIPSAHTHSWTSITDKLVAGSEFNIVNSGFNSKLWFNYLPINDRSKLATISAYYFGNGARGFATVQASGFIKIGSSSSYVLLGDGGHLALSSLNGSHNHDDRYLKLVGGTMNGNARIGHGSGNLYIGNSGNDGWLAVQDICSQDSIGDGNWSIRVNGTAHFQSINFPSNRVIAQVSTGSNSPLNGIKLPNLGSNGIGIFSRVNNGADEGGIILSEDTSVIYNSFDTGWGLSVRDKDRNQTDISGDGTIAFGVRQDYRAYSLGGFEKSGSNNSYVLLGGGDHKLESSLRVAYASNADMVDGEHASSFVRAGSYESANLNSLDTYSFIKSVYSTNNSTSPKGNTGWYNVIQLVHRNGTEDGPSYIGQIALGMTTNTNDMFFRGKRTDPWKTVIHSGNYTEFINNYYWANVKISTSSNTQTQPSVNTIYANNWFRSQGTSGWYSESYGGGIWMNDSNWIRTYGGKSFYCDNQIYSSSSIRMGNILLEHADEINNSANGGIHLNYRNSGNVSLCQGGGSVGIGTTSPSYKLDVNGQMRAGGFHHGSVNSDNYILLAGGGYKSYGGDDSTPIFLGYLNLDHGNNGTVSSSFYCLGYSVPFTYTRGGNYCRISIPDTTRLSFYINAAIASVNYSGGGMDTWVGVHRSSGAWWLHCYASGWNEVRVKGFRQSNENNDSWWGGNPLFSNNDGANRITVCIFGHVRYK